MIPRLIINLRRESVAFPSLWKGELSTDEFIFMRFRHGLLRIGVGPTMDDAFMPGYDGRKGDILYLDEAPFEYIQTDGFMTDWGLRDFLRENIEDLLTIPDELFPDDCGDHKNNNFWMGCVRCGKPMTNEQIEKLEAEWESTKSH